MQCLLMGSPHDDESSLLVLLSLPQSACHTKDKIIEGREAENQQQTQLLRQCQAECENLSLKIKVRIVVSETIRSSIKRAVKVIGVVFLLQSDEKLVQQVKKEKQEFASVQSKLKILEVYN